MPMPPKGEGKSEDCPNKERTFFRILFSFFVAIIESEVLIKCQKGKKRDFHRAFSERESPIKGEAKPPKGKRKAKKENLPMVSGGLSD